MTWPRRPCWWCGRTVAHTPQSGRPARHLRHDCGGAVCYGVANAPTTAVPYSAGVRVQLPESDVEATDG